MNFDAYTAFKLIGILSFTIFGATNLARHRFSPVKSFVLTALIVAGGFVASRSWYIVQSFLGSDPYGPPDLWTAWDDAGSVLYGWILGGFTVAAVMSRIFRWPLYRVTDALAPWALVGQILNRFGCFEAGCCFGKPGHSVQLYEAAWDFLILLLLWRFGRGKEGRATFLYICAYAAGRFILEYFRGDNQPALLGLTVPQITSLIILIYVILLSQGKQKRSSH